MSQTDGQYTGSIPAFYDRYLGSVLFEPFAAVLAAQTKALAPTSVLETAAGTGILTRALAETLPETTTITATDLNQAMLDAAIAKLPSDRVTWQACNAMQLPFADGSFDCLVCQFGVMFFPSKIDAYSEARRVLAPGGTFLFSVWDRIETNPIPQIVADAVAALYPDDPPDFHRRTPYGHNDIPAISGQLRAAGFSGVEATVVTLPMTSPSARHSAVGGCQGSPLGAEVEARNPTGLAAATDAVETALKTRFGDGPMASTMQAIVFAAT